MFCIACIIFAHDVAVKLALALLFMFRNKNMSNTYNDACAVTRVEISKYGLYMFCVACMIYASDVAVQCAIADLFMSKKKKMQQQRAIRVF